MRAVPLLQGLKKGHWSQLKYKGDPMLRPAGTHEIRWLAVLLVRISLALNRALGLNLPPPGEQEPIAENILQVRGP